MSSNTNNTSFAAIIGHGQISSHIPKIFSALNSMFSSEFIFLDRNFKSVPDNVSSVFLAVQDKNIEATFNTVKNHFSEDTQFYHLSGALFFKDIIGLHPLMTLSQDSKNIEYQKIPIFTDSETFFINHRSRFKNLKYISPDQKLKYHAMAVLLGNFTQYYLQIVKENFPSNLNFLDYKMLIEESVNTLFDFESAADSKIHLTGPVLRKDELTISKHRQNLKIQNPKLFKIYNHMQSLFEQELIK